MAGAVAAGPKNARTPSWNIVSSGPPDVEGELAARHQDPTHFAHALRAVRKILEPFLAEHDIEAVIVKRKFGSASEMPLDIGVLMCGIEHGFVDLDPGDLAVRFAYSIHLSGDQAGTACNVQHAVAILTAGLKDEIVSPWRLHGVCIMGVETRSITANLLSTHVSLL